jgi:hypothetical protein
MKGCSASMTACVSWREEKASRLADLRNPKPEAGKVEAASRRLSVISKVGILTIPRGNDT